MTDPVSRLANTLGPEATVTDPNRLAAYAVDGWQPALAVFPSSPEETALVLESASEGGVGVTPWGSGTRMGLGLPPHRAGAVLCTSRMAGITEFNPENLTITVQAGATLKSVQEAVRAEGLRVPLDPPYADRATIGGILAANSCGPRRLLYGAPRDLALGLRAVLPDGRIIKAGGKTVKNVAGYDLAKLFVGSLGTLGVIVEATLKLRPLQDERILVLSCGTMDGAGEVLRRIMARADLVPAALELMDAAACQLVAEGAALALSPGPAVAVALEGFAEEVAAQASRLADLAPATIVGDSPPLQRLLADGLRPGMAARAGVPAGRVAEFMEAATSRASRGWGLDCPAVAGAGTGTVRLYPRAESDSPGRLSGFLKEARALASSIGGYLVLEEAPAQVKAAVGVWGDPGPAFPAMRRIKAIFDPTGVLNNGRFVGGI